MCIHIYNNKKTKILFSIHIDMCIHICYHIGRK